MPVYQDVAPPAPKTFEAEAAITFNRMVKLGTGSNKVVPVSGITDQAIGIAVESADPAAGNSAVSVWLFNEGGIVPVESAASFSLHALLAPSANGRAQTAVSTQFVRGVALAAAGGAGEFIPMLVEVRDQAV